jgi:uncharacterized protein YhfF
MKPELESFSFGDGPELADELLKLVLIGKKTATSWAASEGDKGVAVGKRWIVRDGQGFASAILETVEVLRRRFGEVDCSLAHWRQAHTAYFTRRGEFSPNKELYCERFRLVEVLKRT